ncbi:MAG: Cupin domain protein [Verrucomicrobia bacterium]|jgi:uncharacterized cupin superfamily protein|nr:Cupin domain protein [Verrucomicrobiota bacterium]
MQKVNLAAIPENEDSSPKGKYRSYYKGISEALGREIQSTDTLKRHPFDLEWNRIPPGASQCPYHFHTQQWELYLVISGTGTIRDEEGLTEVVAGDAFLFKAGEAHQISNRGTEDFVYLIVADNPMGEGCYYPDSGKWLVAAGTKNRKVVQVQEAKYYDGEE